MIQSILIFAFGFASALLACLLIAPAIWRRAAFLTRKRIESALPLTANELRAEKDRLRADYALQVRRVEMDNEKLRTQAAGRAAEVGRLGETIKKRDASIAELTTQRDGLEGTVAERDARIADLSSELSETVVQREALDAQLEAVRGENDLLANQLTDQQARVADLTARLETAATDLQGARDAISKLREQRKDDQARGREQMIALRNAEEALRNEKLRTADTEERLERAIRDRTRMEEKLARRDSELTRLRETWRQGPGAAAVARAAGDLPDAHADEAPADARREALEAQIADLSAQLADLRAEKESLNVQLQASTLSNLFGDAGDHGPSGDGDAALRRELQGIAAEFARMTARLEGPGSPVLRLVAGDGAEHAPGSLAARITELLADDTADSAHHDASRSAAE